MALPRINEVPEYEMVIPSTGSIIKYRPFLVKEQKILLIAFESQDKKQILNAIISTLQACLPEDVKVENLPSFDIDYIFTQIRSKSVGETVDIIGKCQHCDHKNKLSINLTEITPPQNIKKEIIIELTSDISLEMEYPTYSNLFNSMLTDEASQTEVLMKFIISCIKYLITSEEKINMKDESLEEKQRFIGSLNASQFQKLSEFINQLPQLEKDISYVCENCNKENEKTVKGMEDFFL